LIVPAKPYLSFTRYSKPRNTSFRFNKFYFFPSGVDAIISWLKKNNLPVGSNIILPAFICRVVPISLISNQYNVKFIDINDKLLIDIEKLSKPSKSVKTLVLLVDFFGFLYKENIKISKDLKKKGFLVLHDRCHSAFSGDFFKSSFRCDNLGDSIYSFRKTFTSFNSGAFYSKDLNSFNPLIEKISFYFLLFLLLNILEKLISRVGLINFYSPIVTTLKLKTFKLLNKFHNSKSRLPNLHCKINILTYLRLSDFSFISDIALRRRRNYLLLQKILTKHGFQTFFEGLDDFTVPQCIVILESPNLLNFLRKNSVGAYNWPGNELYFSILKLKKFYPRSAYFAENLICIPIHQDIRMKHICKIETIIKNYIKSNKKNEN
jgi:dTDP-4-amino-4,6-dideoxygalactose transaminase